ncbi:MAG: hypothetical protein ACE5EI_06495 [Thermodesulfobacteriota bacterium]
MADVICPRIKGSEKGAICSICGAYIKDLKGADIDLCLSGRFGSCPYIIDYMRHVSMRTGDGRVV